MQVLKAIRLFILIFLPYLLFSQGYAQVSNGNYSLVVEGFDWGAAASKLILSLQDSTTEINAAQLQVFK